MPNDVQENSRPGKLFAWWKLGAALAGLCLCALSGWFIHMNSKHAEGSVPTADINAVLARHDKELMAIPGVVGVYIGLAEDEKTPCLHVMLARPDESLKKRIPSTLEGVHVITEVSGQIRPMGPAGI